MNHISPTRVSIYDFLFEDTLPLTVLLADIAQLSLPQARIAHSASLQALVSALLSYQARHKGTAVIKKLFARGGIKDLRQYNSMNFVTITAALYHRQAVADALFPDSRRVTKAAEHIAAQIDATPSQVYTLLTTLSVIALRELAILTDYAQLDGDDMDNWLRLQPQFLNHARFTASPPESTPTPTTSLPTTSLTSTSLEASNDPLTDGSSEVYPPEFDPFWFNLVDFSPPAPASTGIEGELPHYAKLIGRSAENASQSLHDDLIAFAPMPSISLPHQRWLLQLAKISDIYLSRHRLQIASEPKTPPSRPLVNLRLLTHSSPASVAANDAPLDEARPIPIWKNPVILLIFFVIGALSAMAFLKYQSQQSQRIALVTELTEEFANREQQKASEAIASVIKDGQSSTAH